jgi:putative uncharacterized protein nol
MSLKNGYYISAYCVIDKLGNILNCNIRHDQNITLWELSNQHLKLIHHWELERISGLKHNETPFFSIEDFYECLNSLLFGYDLTINDIVKLIGIKLPDNELDDKFHELLSYHSLCHLYSSLLTNTKLFYNHDILCLALDGGPDFGIERNARFKFFYSGAYSQKGQITLFPISSPGYFWTYVSDVFSMPEGTLMALAYASTSESNIEIGEIPDVFNYNDIGKANKYLSDIINEIMSYSNEDIGIKFNGYDSRYSENENKISMVMKIVQKVSLKMIDKTVNKVLSDFQINPNETYISLSGGFCLNCPANTHLMSKYKFIGQITIPCINDGGQAIGIGLKYFAENVDNLSFLFKDAYYGDDAGTIDAEFETYIEEVINDMSLFTKDIENDPLIWIAGRAEVGPRALGHRSILADPRMIESKDKLNIIKQRQWWRPVAPIILEEECSSWFEESFSSPYMLNNFTLKQSKRVLVPAIIHMDNTARVQTIGKENDLLYKVLRQFYKETGVPILCNTSLNDKGEPIINTINQAINFALRKNIRIIYFNGKRYLLKSHNLYKERFPLKRNDSYFTKYMKNENLIHELNPFHINELEYILYKSAIGDEEEKDCCNENDAKYIKCIAKKINKLRLSEGG